MNTMKKNTKKLLYFLAFLIIPLLVSCNLKPINSTVNITTNEADDTISNFFTSLKKGNLKNASEYLDKSNEIYNSDLKFRSPLQENILKKEFSRLEYKILSTSNNYNAKVVIEITSPDLLSIYNGVMSKSLEELVSKYLSGNDAEQLQAKNELKKVALDSVNSRLSRDDFPKITKVVKLDLSLVDEKLVITPNEDFLYVLTGRMPQLLKNIK